MSEDDHMSRELLLLVAVCAQHRDTLRSEDEPDAAMIGDLGRVIERARQQLSRLPDRCGEFETRRDVPSRQQRRWLD